MRARTLVLRSLRFYLKPNLGVLLGAALGTAVIVGALGAGDSVRGTMKDLVDSRLGSVEHALVGGDRLFRASLAGKLELDLDVPAAAVLRLRGTASAEGGRRRANRVNVLGVDARFMQLWPDAAPWEAPGEDRAVVNSALAARLGLEAGDEMVLRVGRAGGPPGDLPLTSERDAGAALRLTVAAVADERGFGRFSLRTDQRWPLNVFVSREQLGEISGAGSRANVLLVAGGGKGRSPAVDAALDNAWRPADAGLRIRELGSGGGLELVSERVFLGGAEAKAALGAAKGARGVFTYFVNELRSGGKATPYSFVAAPGGAPVPDGMADDEVVINSWLAEDLGAESGGRLEMSYYVPGPMRGLEERSAPFRVRAVVPIEGPAADRRLMPEFPGVTGVEDCSDWDLGKYIDTKKVREKDEAYWDRHRGTPKAFVTAAAARKMWASRFGELTAVRYPPGTDPDALSAELARRLPPASLGLAFVPVRDEGLRAAASGVDFGGLFLGLSFFIVAAALLLTGMLFAFGAENRAAQTGALLALGFSPRRARRVVLAEGALLALGGAVLGAPGGVLFTVGVLGALGGVWSGAMPGTSPILHVGPSSLLAGGAAGAACGFLAMWIALRSHLRLTPRELLAGRASGGAASAGGRRLPLTLSALCALGAAVLVALTPAGRGREAAAAFFAAGGLLLVAALALSTALLRGLAGSAGSRAPGALRMGLRGLARRRGRCLAAAGAVACGVFVLAAVAANRHDPAAEPGRRDSGTGGFAFYAETSRPMLHDLTLPEGRRAMGLDGDEWSGFEFVQMRVREGDDASCLNLNRVGQPRLLGVRGAQLAGRGAFTFAALTADVPEESPWSALETPADAEVVPGVADHTVIAWSLGLSEGDTIAYTDEGGRTFRVKLVAGLANSVLQGSVLISERAFAYRFPSEAGSRAALIDAPAGSEEKGAAALRERMRDLGLDLQSAGQRLREFSAVENTYLSIFLLLGGLGLLLGTAGSGVLVMRSALERRGEMAVLRAVGFSRRRLRRTVFAENAALLAWGLVCGGCSAAVAVLPAALSPGGEPPWARLAGLLAAVAAAGAAASWLAAHLAVRGDLLPALRDE
ncbi:MAG: ABC transporter permease [Planctomycetota bacterium]|jgi:putative ABC transport system permease protein